MKKILVSAWCLMLIFAACNTGAKNEVTSSDPATSNTKNLEERNKMVAMETINGVINNNINEAFKNTTVDVVEYGDGSMDASKGLDTLKANVKMWMSKVENYKGENLEAVAEGNKVMVYGDWSGKFKGDMMGMKSAGKTFKVKDVDYFTFNDEGKITEHRSVQSFASMVASAK